MIHQGSETLAELTGREIHHFKGAGTQSLYRSLEVEISQAKRVNVFIHVCVQPCMYALAYNMCTIYA